MEVDLHTAFSGKPGVSVIVPCRNEVGHIHNCLHSIMAQQAPPDGFEVIVADGMSDDGTRAILNALCQEDARLRVVDNPLFIASSGLNLAIRCAKADLILRMDAHTEYASDYIKSCVDLIQTTGADNVGGPARTKSETYMEQAIAAAFHSRFSVGGAKFHRTDYEGVVDTVVYGCWRREVFERFGYFDEELTRNQDDEHNLRITRGGGKIWQSPKIRSWYHPRGSLVLLFNQYMQYGYWKVRVIQKHKLPASWRHLVPGAFLLTLLLFSGLFALSFLSSKPGLDMQWPLLALVLLYGGCMSVACLLTAGNSGWKLLPVLPGVFACFHFGYGCGFLLGLWDFMIRRRGPRAAFQMLCR